MGICYDEHIEERIALLSCILNLKRHIVGVAVFEDAAAYEQHPAKPFKTSLSFCSMVRLAAQGHARKADVSHVSCPGARRALGLDPVTEEYTSGQRYLSLGMYADLDQAARTAAVVSRITRPTVGVAVQPLRLCPQPPHAAIIFCSAYQAMRLVQGLSYADGGLDGTFSLGNQGVCAELTARPLETGRANVSLLCSNTRYSCAWGEGEVGVGLPVSLFAGAVDGVLATLDAAEPDDRKRAIAARAEAAGLDVPVRLGGAYYLGSLAPSAAGAK